MAGALNQMQMLYSAEEDRILFRVNTTDAKEYRFWLTRRFVHLLFRVLSDHLAADPDISLQHSREAKRAIADFKKEQVMEKANFAQPFRDEAEFPLGQDAMLAYKITSKKSDDQLHLGIHPRDQQGISMVINREINTTLTQLLLGAVRKAQWNIVIPPRDQAQPDPPDDSTAGNRIIN